MKIAVPREIAAGERRVALVPDGVSRLIAAGFSVQVEKGAGEAANFSDQSYADAGAAVVEDRRALWQEADVVLKVQRPTGAEGGASPGGGAGVGGGAGADDPSDFDEVSGSGGDSNPDDASGSGGDSGSGSGRDSDELSLLREGAVLISFLNTLQNPHVAARLAERRVTALGMDAIPRIARAQSMDALSSMASIAGYRAVLLAAERLPKYMPLLITAAGTVPPAKGLILGAGVAGLQAIATARRLGAVLSAFDVRPAVKEQVESLGASFVEVDYGLDAEDAGGYARELPPDAQERQLAAIHEVIKDMDFVITTAAIPGRPAPKLITKEMVADMRSGAVIVDIAAETGGNCELTVAGEDVVVDGVTILGPVNMASAMATVASQFYSRNMLNLIMHLQEDGRLRFDFEDQITDGVVITYDGEVRHGPTRALLGLD